MRWIAAVVMALSLAAPAAAPAAANDRWVRARLNYEALVNGTRQIGQLTPQELADIAELDRRLRERDQRPPQQRCVENELARAGSPVSRLERRVIDMKCREAGD